MDVAPHPHCGLATVSWLFSGEVEHRDSLGTVAVVRPGEVNLMTAGRGISHSEVSTPRTSVLHGVQLWVVLPAAVGGGRAAVRAPRAGGRRRRAGSEGAGVRRLAVGVGVARARGDAARRGGGRARGRCRAGGARASRGSRCRSSSTPGRWRSVGGRSRRGELAVVGAARRHPGGVVGARRGRGGAGARARRGAVRRGGRHVVELHRPLARGRRRGARGVGGRAGAVRVGARATRGRWSASRRRRCRGCGCGRAATAVPTGEAAPRASRGRRPRRCPDRRPAAEERRRRAWSRDRWSARPGGSVGLAGSRRAGCRERAVARVRHPCSAVGRGWALLWDAGCIGHTGTAHASVTRKWRNGRRAGFRCQCPKGRGGSNPPLRTRVS